MVNGTRTVLNLTLPDSQTVDSRATEDMAEDPAANPDRAAPASFDLARMRQTFIPKSFSAFRKAIFSLASRGRLTARNQSVPSFMFANG